MIRAGASEEVGDPQWLPFEPSSGLQLTTSSGDPPRPFPSSPLFFSLLLRGNTFFFYYLFFRENIPHNV
jgi:hypothetical protein